MFPAHPEPVFLFLGFPPRVEKWAEASLTYTFSNPATCARCPVHCCVPQTPGKHGLHLYSAARTRDTTCLSYSCPLPCCSHLMDLDPPILPGEPASPGSLLHCPSELQALSPWRRINIGPKNHTWNCLSTPETSARQPAQVSCGLSQHFQIQHVCSPVLPLDWMTPAQLKPRSRPRALLRLCHPQLTPSALPPDAALWEPMPPELFTLLLGSADHRG